MTKPIPMPVEFLGGPIDGVTISANRIRWSQPPSSYYLKTNSLTPVEIEQVIDEPALKIETAYNYSGVRGSRHIYVREGLEEILL